MMSIVGGKFTTYRHMAEFATDAVLRRLNKRQKCRTHGLPLDGAPEGSWSEFFFHAVEQLKWRFGVEETSARHLANRYGRRAVDVAAYIEGQPHLNRRVVPTEPDLLVEFAYQREHEMAVREADCLLRRTRLGLFHPHLLNSTAHPWRLRRA